jgi:hypothetical protein
MSNANRTFSCESYDTTFNSHEDLRQHSIREYEADNSNNPQQY